MISMKKSHYFVLFSMSVLPLASAPKAPQHINRKGDYTVGPTFKAVPVERADVFGLWTRPVPVAPVKVDRPEVKALQRPEEDLVAKALQGLEGVGVVFGSQPMVCFSGEAHGVGDEIDLANAGKTGRPGSEKGRTDRDRNAKKEKALIKSISKAGVVIAVSGRDYLYTWPEELRENFFEDAKQ